MNTSQQSLDNSRYSSIHLGEIINEYLEKCKSANVTMSKRKLSKLLGIPKSTLCNLASQAQNTIQNSGAVVKILQLKFSNLSSDEIVKMFSENIYFGKCISVFKQPTKEIKKTHPTDRLEYYLDEAFFSDMLLQILIHDGFPIQLFEIRYGRAGIEMLNELSVEGALYFRDGKIYSSNSLLAQSVSKFKFVRNLAKYMSDNPIRTIFGETEIVHTNPIIAGPLIKKITSEYREKLKQELKKCQGDVPVHISTLISSLPLDKKFDSKGETCLH